jgi:hypothetical protein
MAEKTKKAPKTEKTAKAPAAESAEAATGEKCKVEGCKQAYRAKGYCRKHYLAWRRGDLGKKQRYNTCSKEGCRKPTVAAGRCEEHKKGTPAAAAA